MICSAKHEKAIIRFQSRIKIIKWDLEGEGFPTICAQCEEAPFRGMSLCQDGQVKF